MNLPVQFSKYVIVAAISAASDWLVFITLMMFFHHAVGAYAAARIAGAIVSFFVNKHWSFQSRDLHRAPVEAGRFLLLFAFSYTIAVLLFYGLTFTGLSAYWAKLLADTTCFFINFALMRQWVYRHAAKVDIQPAANIRASETGRPAV